MKNKFSIIKRLFIILPILLISFGATAQTRYTLKLTVTSALSASLTGTPVELENPTTGMLYNRTLPANGYLEFGNLIAGTYNLSIAKEGHKPYINNGLVINEDVVLSVELTENSMDPYGLKAEVSYSLETGKGDVDFSWNNDLESFFDDFEQHEDFSISFSPWTGIDMDKATPYQFDIAFPNSATPQYATIFNPASTTPSRFGYTEMMPYSRLKCVAFFRVNDAPNNDWLIAPKYLVKEGDVVSFMAKSLGVNFPEEYFRVLVSTTGNTDVADFTIISAGNSESATPEWTKFEYDLKDYAGQEVYIAINYVSIYRQMLMVDDFFMGRASSYKSAKLKRVTSTTQEEAFPKYAVSVDGVEKATITGESYTITNLPGGTYTLGVKAIYQTTETEVKTIDVTIDDADNFAPFAATVATNNGESADGFIAYLTNKDANIIYTRPVINGEITIPFARKGNYELSIQIEGYEDYSQEFTLTTGTNTSIVLKEQIADPYNLTIDVALENGKTVATLIWNQELGWTDGFESYDDFTQNPTPWTAHDLDQVVSYVIGWGTSAGQTYQFPGAGQAMGPIIFNPSATQPTMSGDPAALAANGSKYAAFLSAQRAVSNDWLISPAQSIKKNYVLQFLLKAYPMYGVSDKIRVCVSETNNVNNFTVLDEIIPDTDNWIQYELSLSDYEGKDLYIAFNYISNDGFFVQLDDVYVGPSTINNAVGLVERFEIYLNDALQGSVTTNTYRFENLLPETTYKAGVKAIYKSGASNVTEITFDSRITNTAIEEIAASAFNIYAQAGTLFIGSDFIVSDIYIYNITGACVKTVSGIDKESFELNVSDLPAGIYIVHLNTTYGNKAVKVLIN